VGAPTDREGHLVSHRLARFGITALGVGALLTPVAAAAPASASATTSGSLIRASGQHSSNWSGYGLAGSFSAVTGSWVVPTATPSAATTYASTWIGIDGLANRNLIQTGTESDVINGVVHYDAWWEVLPAAETVIAKLTVSPGDHMTAAITRGVGKKWTISLTDTTSGASFSYSRNYKGIGTSAEWIVERPQIGRTLATLTNYGSTTFTGLTANGSIPGLVPSEAISMVGDAGTNVISTPSAPSARGDAFAVAYGPFVPTAPAG
jgi:hypothetical protein